jgi:alpha-1,3-mannosyl-glycoprotein beta-1,2-N-acetylglucosaminyltransferase
LIPLYHRYLYDFFLTLMVIKKKYSVARDLWGELGPKWARSYWDDWIREPAQRRDRACLRPEISRTKTFGKVGVSNGLFFDKHLKFIKLNDRPVDFSKLDLNYLKKDAYDSAMQTMLNSLPVVSLDDLRADQQPAVNGSSAVRVIYHHKLAFKQYAKQLGIMTTSDPECLGWRTGASLARCSRDEGSTWRQV